MLTRLTEQRSLSSETANSPSISPWWKIATPVVGIIHIPVTNRLFMADVREGCWEISDSGRRRLKVAQVPANGPVRIVRSRSHPSPGLEELLSLIPCPRDHKPGERSQVLRRSRRGSRFLSEVRSYLGMGHGGRPGDSYSRRGIMLDLSGKPFVYNKENLLNGPFIVSSSMEWLRKTGISGKGAEITYTVRPFDGSGI